MEQDPHSEEILDNYHKDLLRIRERGDKHTGAITERLELIAEILITILAVVG